MIFNSTIDPLVAAECIKSQKENGTYRGAKIGRVTEGFFGMAGDYQKGEIVLFKPESAPGPRMFTVESPLCQADIEKRRREGNLTTTTRRIYNVPAKYVREVRHL